MSKLIRLMVAFLIILALILPVIPAQATTDWLGTWAHRIPLTVDNTNVSANLTNYPLMINLSATSGITSADVTAVFTNLGNNYLKIAVTDNDASPTQYPVEVAYWDSVSKVGKLFAKVPTVTTATTTSLYLYYDSRQANNSTYVGVTGSAVAQSVWDSNYKLVNHLAQFNLEAYKQGIGYTTVASDNYYCTEPSVVAPDQSPDHAWHMWAHVLKNRSASWHDDVWHFTSSDGLTWTEDAEALKDVYRQHVFYNATDGKYWLYGTTDQANINLYTSATPTGFTLDTANCITKGANVAVYSPAVYPNNATPTDMVYEVNIGTGIVLGHATTTDGKSWTQDPANPMIITGWNSGGACTTGAGGLHKVGSTWYVLGHGKPNEDGGVYGEDIWLGSSTDLHTLTMIGGSSNPFITRTQTWEGAGLSDGQVADPYWWEYNGSTYIIYDGIQDQTPGAGTAHTFCTVKYPAPMSTLLGMWANMYDSTSNANNFASGATRGQESINPASGGGISFNSSYSLKSYLIIPDSASLSALPAMTVEVYENKPAAGTVSLLSKVVSSVYEWTVGLSTTLNYSLISANTANQMYGHTTSTVSTGVNHVLGFTWDGVNATGHTAFYIDGASDTVAEETKAGTGYTPHDTAVAVYVGNYNDLTSYSFNGKYREVRVSNIARSAAWLKAENYNLKDTLVTYGASEDLPSEPTPTPTPTSSDVPLSLTMTAITLFILSFTGICIKELVSTRAWDAKLMLGIALVLFLALCSSVIVAFYSLF